MNTFPFKNREKDKVVIVGQKEVEKKTQLLGSIKAIKGHTIFEINLKEKTVEPATFEEDVLMYPTSKPKSKGMGFIEYKDGTKKLVIDGPRGSSKKIIKKADCVYVSALNKKNVIKKLFRIGLLKIEE